MNVRTILASCSLLFLSACQGSAKPEVAPEAKPEQAPVAAAPSQAQAEPAAGGACLHEGPGCAQEAPPTDETSGHFGAPFAVAKAQSLTEAIAQLQASGQERSEPVQVRGTIGPVCQKRGCWMMLQDGEQKARVIMAGGAFSVPRDGTGKAATVEGTIKTKTLSAAQVAHLAEDEGKPADAAAAPRVEYIFTATAVEIPAS